MSSKVFTCFIVFFLFLVKVPCRSQEIHGLRDTVSVTVPKGDASPHNGSGIRKREPMITVPKGKVPLHDKKDLIQNPLDMREVPTLADSCQSRITFDMRDSKDPACSTGKSPSYEGDFSTSGIIKNDPSGYFYGMGRQTNLIGLGVMNYAGVGYVYSPRHWSLDLRAYTVKWSVPRRESQLLGLSGMMTIPVNEKIRLNTFASYSFMLSSPFSSLNYGGFISYDIVPKWGIDIGIGSHSDYPLNKMNTFPIMAPYFQYKGSKLGIDLGSGLSHLLGR